MNKNKSTMTMHKSGTREEWLAARLELLKAEKELTRRSDELARRRQELPWIRIDKEYRFETDEGSLAGRPLQGRSQLLIYHFMFGPDYTAGCPRCSAIADGFNGFVIHLVNHDVTLWAVSRPPLAKLQAYKRRMGWSFPWASSFGSDFNSTSRSRSPRSSRNRRRRIQLPPGGVEPSLEPGQEKLLAEFAAPTGTDWLTYSREAPGMTRRARGRRRLPHLLGLCARLDGLWGMYQWLDQATRANETRHWPEAMAWFRRHDEYNKGHQYR